MICCVGRVSSDQWRCCHSRPHRSRRIGKTQHRRSLSIGFLLEFDKGVFNLIQLVLGVNKNATLPGFEYLCYIIPELFLSTHPDVRLRMRFEDEFSHDSLSTVINHQVVRLL